jgi:hypothetical protein
MARDWEGKKIYRKVKTRNLATGEIEVKERFVGQDTAKIPARWKRVPMKVWTQWTLGLGRKYAGVAESITKPGRMTFGMEPAHRAFPKTKGATT